jgi:hypothetical protein
MNPETTPTLATDPALLGFLHELISREPIFHRPEWGTTRAHFENITTADFWEVGASGRRYSREDVLAETGETSTNSDRRPVGSRGLSLSRAGQRCSLLTYTLLQHSERKTRRSTIWQRTPDGWKIVFHQGTIVQDS